jgi:hypothetical protein
MLRIAHCPVLLLALGFASGCVETVATRSYPAFRDYKASIRRVAVAPFRATGSLARLPKTATSATPTLATTLIARYVSEALAARGVGVVPAEDVARVLPPAPSPEHRLVPRMVAEIANAEFGADALLMGEVSRYDERSGQAAGTMHPASIGFEVTLYAAPGGERLWHGAFHETQQSLSSNIFSTHRYPGGGMRWLTAEEFARWGATETMAVLPLQ